MSLSLYREGGQQYYNGGFYIQFSKLSCLQKGKKENLMNFFFGEMFILHIDNSTCPMTHLVMMSLSCSTIIVFLAHVYEYNSIIFSNKNKENLMNEP